MSKDLALNAGQLLEDIRKKSPLIWNFSNFVSMDIAANALLAIGASPAMLMQKKKQMISVKYAKLLMVH